MKESWEAYPKSNESVISNVLSVQEQLAKMVRLARDNLQKTQAQQKRCNDKNATEQELKVGEKCVGFTTYIFKQAPS